MTRREAAIVAAYTGTMLGLFSDMHEYIEEIMGRPVFVHELLGNTETANEVRDRAREDFFNLEVGD